jgi:chitinase
MRESLLLKECRFLAVAGAWLLSFSAHGELWCTGYYPGWEQGSMPAAQIDFSALSHVIHFSLVPNADGSLNSSLHGISAENSAEIVSATHAAGRKVLICVGGANTSFQSATTPANLATFVNNLTNFMAARGYDGIDLDWEPISAADTAPFTNLVNALRSALNAFPEPKLLTAAVQAYSSFGGSAHTVPALIASVQSRFDQVNLMTYDLSGAYPGWVTWFNAPLYDGGYRFPSTSGLVPSVHGAVSLFLSNGVSPAKLGIGIAFYGYIWWRIPSAAELDHGAGNHRGEFQANHVHGLSNQPLPVGQRGAGGLSFHQQFRIGERQIHFL